MNRLRWISVFALTGLVAWVLWQVFGERDPAGRSLNLALSNPRWTFQVTNDAPTPFEALFRVGTAVRRVRGTTPAEFRLGSWRLVAQFRPLDINERLLVHSRGSDMGSSSMTFPTGPQSTNRAVTFVSTFGKLGIPRVGAWGISVYPWGAREVFLKPWRLWPDTWVVTDAMVNALPAADPWPPEGQAPTLSGASDPEPRPSGK
jgi:hypothetical protein